MRSSTKCLVTLDVAFQLLLFLSHLGVLIWNNMHPDERDKLFPEFGSITLYVGIAVALPSLELDVFLWLFLEWGSGVALFWWNVACFGIAIGSWCSYIAVTMCIENLNVAIWAFFYLYSRAILIMVARADYLEMCRNAKKSSVKEAVSRCPSTAESAGLAFGSTVPTPMAFRVEIETSESSKSATTRKLDFEDCELDSVNTNGENMTFCTFLGMESTIQPDHYMARDDPIINANEEKQADVELKTKM